MYVVIIFPIEITEKLSSGREEKRRRKPFHETNGRREEYPANSLVCLFGSCHQHRMTIPSGFWRSLPRGGILRSRQEDLRENLSHLDTNKLLPQYKYNTIHLNDMYRYFKSLFL